MPPARFKAPTGTHDVLPPESDRWQALVARFAAAAGTAGYGLIQSPMFEELGVFQRVGEATDVVRKEMYDFEDKGGRHLALRPEGTASVVRAYVQHRPTTPWKVWYAAPSFRYERPQAGRYRQHHQLGVEAVGSDDPDLDVEVITMAWDLFASLGLRRVVLLLNSLGDRACRPAYLDGLSVYLRERADKLCDEHRARHTENPLRVLDCKRQTCRDATRNAPRLIDKLCGPCHAAFERVQQGLAATGIPFAIESRLVRGLDYYTRTTFELQASALESAQNAIGGGGRYDRLVEVMGGDPTPGIGFGLGIERMLLACDAEGVFPGPATTLDVFVVDLTGGDAARDLTAGLRRAGVAADRAFDGRSMRAQMKLADRSGAPLALIVGEDEAAQATVTVRRMEEGGGQETVARDQVIDHVKGLL
ncbi:MAG TPA: histidine--tRNA ligase [Acidimicrobiales bacterium]|nr:histidine--tRNA ligase [Acidimicrobiales bacterium]